MKMLYLSIPSILAAAQLCEPEPACPYAPPPPDAVFVDDDLRVVDDHVWDGADLAGSCYRLDRAYHSTETGVIYSYLVECQP